MAVMDGLYTPLYASVYNHRHMYVCMYVRRSVLFYSWQICVTRMTMMMTMMYLFFIKTLLSVCVFFFSLIFISFYFIFHVQLNIFIAVSFFFFL